jgi:hypothetical protein
MGFNSVFKGLKVKAYSGWDNMVQSTLKRKERDLDV